jgi:hypothetical protein
MNERNSRRAKAAHRMIGEQPLNALNLSLGLLAISLLLLLLTQGAGSG